MSRIFRSVLNRQSADKHIANLIATRFLVRTPESGSIFLQFADINAVVTYAIRIKIKEI